jgi:hypothetical protein
MKAAVVVFLAAAAFLAAVLLGLVRVGSSPPAPHAIELTRTAAVAVARRPVGKPRAPTHSEIAQTVESALVGGYGSVPTAKSGGRGR